MKGLDTRQYACILAHMADSTSYRTIPDGAIKYGRSFREFVDEGLNKPGTLVCVSQSVFLIGDVNTWGGTCDHCVMFGVERDRTVYWYQIVWRA